MLRKTAMIRPAWLLAGLFLLTGCLPGLQRTRVEAPSRASVVSSPLVPPELLKREMEALSARLRSGDLTPREESFTRERLRAYEVLRDTNQRPLEPDEYRRIVLLLFHQSLKSCTGPAEAMERAPTGPRLQGVLQELHGARKAALDAYLAADYQGVIDACNALRKTFGADALTPELGLIFSLSLASRGFVEEALAVAGGVAARMEQTPGLFYLYERMARWQLAVGRKEESRKTLEKLSDLLDERRNLLADLRHELERKEPPTRTDAAAAPERPAEEPSFGLKGPDRILSQVRELVDNGAFEKAREVLASNREAFETSGRPEVFEQALESVRLAEEKFLAHRMDALAREKEALDSSRKLLAEDKPDEAIAVIESLEKVGEPGPEVRRVKQEAVEKLVRRERNRAAMLFLAAKKTTDVKRKKKYLRASFERLRVLVDRYPSSPLIPKVLSNMETIRKELEKLGEFRTEPSG